MSEKNDVEKKDDFKATLLKPVRTRTVIDPKFGTKEDEWFLNPSLKLNFLLIQ